MSCKLEEKRHGPVKHVRIEDVGCAGATQPEVCPYLATRERNNCQFNLSLNCNARKHAHQNVLIRNSYFGMTFDHIKFYLGVFQPSRCNHLLLYLLSC